MYTCDIYIVQQLYVNEISVLIKENNFGEDFLGNILPISQSNNGQVRFKLKDRIVLDFLRKILFVHAQSCPTLCDPTDCSPPGSSVHGISQEDSWSGLPSPIPGDHLNQGLNPSFLGPLGSLHWQADSLPLSYLEAWKML